MNPWIFDDFKQFLDEVEIKNLCEIGTHKGNTAVQMILHLLEKNNDFVYHGYDVFDYARNNVEFNRAEYNGKGGASKEFVLKRLRKIHDDNNQFNYLLYEGLTKNTLHKLKFDFVYLDGGHSLDTVKHDYEKIKESKMIVFDDAVNKNNANDVAIFLKNLESKGENIQYYKRWAIIRNFA